MIIDVGHLAHILEANAEEQHDVPVIGPYVRKMEGGRGNAIYVDVGKGMAEIMSLNPKAGPVENLLRDMIAEGELEGGG